MPQLSTARYLRPKSQARCLLSDLTKIPLGMCSAASTESLSDVPRQITSSSAMENTYISVISPAGVKHACFVTCFRWMVPSKFGPKQHVPSGRLGRDQVWDMQRTPWGNKGVF